MKIRTPRGSRMMGGLRSNFVRVVLRPRLLLFEFLPISCASHPCGLCMCAMSCRAPISFIFLRGMLQADRRPESVHLQPQAQERQEKEGERVRVALAYRSKSSSALDQGEALPSSV